MSHIGSGVEYALHCLLYLVDGDGQPSSRDLAEFQGVSASYVAKLFTRLEKARIVVAAEGVRGGFRLARPATEITVLEVVNAIEGVKPLFDCRAVREHCALFDAPPPPWATSGVCAIHAVMLDAERQMRATLQACTLADLSKRTASKVPAQFRQDAVEWFGHRSHGRLRGLAGQSGRTGGLP